MRKLAVVLIGLVLFAGAFGVFGMRMFGGERSSYSRHWTDSGGNVRGGWRSGESESRASRRSSEWERGRSSSPGGWKLVEMVLDALNVLIGVAGIGLAVMGVRMQRPGMSQNMPLRGKNDA